MNHDLTADLFYALHPDAPVGYLDHDRRTREAYDRASEAAIRYFAPALQEAKIQTLEAVRELVSNLTVTTGPNQIATAVAGATLDAVKELLIEEIDEAIEIETPCGQCESCRELGLAG